MGPPPAATANAPARRHGTGASARPRAGSVSTWRVPALKIVRSRREKREREPGRERERGPRKNRNRLLNTVSITLVVGSLLAVVIGQAILANGQVRLSSMQHKLALEQSSHRRAELAVAELETASRIVGAASAQLHMVHPTQVIELPYVSLSKPLPPPKVAPGPGLPAATAPVATAPAHQAAATPAGGSPSGGSGASASAGSAKAPTAGGAAKTTPSSTSTSEPATTPSSTSTSEPATTPSSTPTSAPATTRTSEPATTPPSTP